MPTLLNVGNDAGVANLVAGVAASKHGLTIESAPSRHVATHRLKRNGIALAVLHVPSSDQFQVVSDAANFLLDTAISGRSVPTIVVTD